VCLSAQTFLGNVLLCTELLVILKFGKGMYKQQMNDFQVTFVGAFFAYDTRFLLPFTPPVTQSRCVLWL
jgi:hypothetical protein